MASLELNLDLIAAGDEIKFDGIKKKKITRIFAHRPPVRSVRLMDQPVARGLKFLNFKRFVIESGHQVWTTRVISAN